ncbi:MAG TPA: YhcH/YjgK/YiaL family protein [Opitutaceae bacterium]|nr:YhcH/YjgK/YiaL family protein [Opitutaceae bacterium]
MAIFGSLSTVQAQAPRTPAFAVAWPYIEELMRPEGVARGRLARLRPGESYKHELAGGVFAIEQAYDTKSRSAVFFESHRKYIDIQVVVEGSETMEVIDLGRATVDQPYQEAKDLVMYRDAAGATVLSVRTGEAAVFFPPDVHMPSLQADGRPGLVRKSVLKLPVAG